jgi:hypothetical protein
METIKQVFQVERDEIAYLRVTLESYDGMAVVRTLDPLKAFIEIQIAPGCQSMVDEVVEDLRRREGIKLVRQSE